MNCPSILQVEPNPRSSEFTKS